jgi:hypothetical protein
MCALVKEKSMFKTLSKVPYWYLIAIPLLSIGLGAASNQAVLVANWDKFPVMLNNEQIAEKCQPPAPPENIFQLLNPIVPIRKLNHSTSLFEARPAHFDAQACAAGGDFFDGDDVHVIMHKQSKLKWLADVFNFGGDIYSIGDGGIELGSWLLSWTPIAWLALIVRKFIET